DPLDAHLGTTIDSHKKGEVQAAIGRLAALTQELRCGALGLAHFNKAGITDLLTRINGSYDIQTILKISPMPPLDAMLVFRGLLAAGHIRLEEP
ncbi:MAG: hypothetical protein GY778_16970, partial [bacterium]|nr:hypothetical protein [bacterium]